MARLFQSGFELNSTTSGVEFTTVSGAGVSIDSATVRSGTYALKTTSTASTQQGVVHQFAAAASNGPYILRVYLYISTAPTGNNGIIAFSNGTLITSTVEAYIYVTNTNTLILNYNNAGSLTQIGSASSSLKLKTWYMIEMKVDESGGAGAHVVEAKIDGVAFASASNLTVQAGVLAFRLGTNMAGNPDTAGVFYYDDIAVNDSTSTSQTNYPGNGHIVHLKPSTSGDANSFTVQVGGTVGSANNYTRVNEVTPDDATSYNGSAVLNQEDLFNCDDFTGGAFGNINVVAVGVRMADLVGVDATAAFKVELIKVSGGTKSQSADIIPNSTSFITNAAVAPRNYPLVLYNDPDGVPWRQATLDSMQIGYILDVINVQTIAISTVWASVEYTDPPQGTTTSVSSTSSTSSSISTTSSSTSSTSSSVSTTSASTSSTSSSISTSSTSSSTSSTSSSISSTSSSSTSASTSISSTSSSISSTSMSSTSLSSTSSSSSLSSTSSSFSSTSSSISSTSHSTSSTSVSSTSSSSSVSTTTIPYNLDYSYQDALTLPGTSTDDVDIDSNKNVQNVAVNDGDYFIQYGSEYMAQEYKKKWTNNTDTPSFTYKGRSTESTLVSPIIVQIYNQTAENWETLAVVNKTVADTDFQVTVTQSANVANYYDSNNIVTFRVYQQVI